MNEALGIMLRIEVDALFSVLVLRLPETVFLFVVLPLIVYRFYTLHKGLSGDQSGECYNTVPFIAHDVVQLWPLFPFQSLISFHLKRIVFIIMFAAAHPIDDCLL